MKYRFISYLFIFSFIIIQFFGCSTTSETSEPRTYTHFCFDTVCTITIYSTSQENESDIVNDCFKLCDKYDQLLNKHNKESEIYKINTQEADSDNLTISTETLELIKKSKYYSDLSNGAFDITISPIVDLWDINNHPHIPQKNKISKTLKYVNYKDIILKDNIIRFSQKNQSIDLGGIAKGYVADKIKRFLKRKKSLLPLLTWAEIFLPLEIVMERILILVL